MSHFHGEYNTNDKIYFFYNNFFYKLKKWKIINPYLKISL